MLLIRSDCMHEDLFPDVVFGCLPVNVNGSDGCAGVCCARNDKGRDMGRSEQVLMFLFLFLFFRSDHSYPSGFPPRVPWLLRGQSRRQAPEPCLQPKRGHDPHGEICIRSSAAVRTSVAPCRTDEALFGLLMGADCSCACFAGSAARARAESKRKHLVLVRPSRRSVHTDTDAGRLIKRPRGGQTLGNVVPDNKKLKREQRARFRTLRCISHTLSLFSL